ELPPWPAVLQKAAWPAAEIAGIRGDDRVIGQMLAQPCHDLPEIEHRRLAKSGGIQPLLVFGARFGPPGAPARVCDRLQRRNRCGEFRHARLDRDRSAAQAASLQPLPPTSMIGRSAAASSRRISARSAAPGCALTAP